MLTVEVTTHFGGYRPGDARARWTPSPLPALLLAALERMTADNKSDMFKGSVLELLFLFRSTIVTNLSVCLPEWEGQ